MVAKTGPLDAEFTTARRRIGKPSGQTVTVHLDVRL